MTDNEKDDVYMVFVGKSALENVALILQDYIKLLNLLKEGELIDAYSFEDIDGYYEYVKDTLEVFDMILTTILQHEEFDVQEEGYNGK